MKHLSLAILSAAVVLGLASTPAHADFIVLDEKPVRTPVVNTPTSQPPKPAPLNVVDPAKTIPVSTPVSKPVPASEPVPVSTPVSKPVVVPASATSASQGRLVQVGAPMPGPALGGWAKDVPLSLAMEQVLPSGWTLEVNGVDMDKSVSWRGGRSWHAIVGDLAYGHRFDARVDWVKQQVTLGPAGSLAPSVAGSVAPVTKEEATPAPAVVTVPVVPVVKPAPPVVPVVPTWTLDPKKTLRENIDAWGQKAGWHVVWEGADYPVYAPASFTGAFDSEEGPVATVISAYDDSDQPLLARLHRRDRVIHVSNRGYVPTTVVPTAPSEIAPSSFPHPGLDN